MSGVQATQRVILCASSLNLQMHPTGQQASRGQTQDSASGSTEHYASAQDPVKLLSNALTKKDVALQVSPSSILTRNFLLDT